MSADITNTKVIIVYIQVLLLQVSLIRRFFDHVLEVKPTIISTFNGDSFDW